MVTDSRGYDWGPRKQGGLRFATHRVNSSHRNYIEEVVMAVRHSYKTRTEK